jgi:hypothetical protein
VSALAAAIAIEAYVVIVKVLIARGGGGERQMAGSG